MFVCSFVFFVVQFLCVLFLCFCFLLALCYVCTCYWQKDCPGIDVQKSYEMNNLTGMLYLSFCLVIYLFICSVCNYNPVIEVQRSYEIKNLTNTIASIVIYLFICLFDSGETMTLALTLRSCTKLKTQRMLLLKLFVMYLFISYFKYTSTSNFRPSESVVTCEEEEDCLCVIKIIHAYTRLTGSMVIYRLFVFALAAGWRNNTGIHIL